ncbi:MAG: DUF167 domain-containing protein [Pirellulaceae bacterium]
MIDLTPHPQGVLLPVRASAGARDNGLRGFQDGALKVAVTQAAEKGKANKAIISVLAKALGLRRSQIELASGPTSSQKRFLVREVTLEALRRAIEQATGQATEP